MDAGAFLAAASHPGAHLPPTMVSGPRHILDSDPSRSADRAIGARRSGRTRRTERFRCAWSCGLLRACRRPHDQAHRNLSVRRVRPERRAPIARSALLLGSLSSICRGPETIVGGRWAPGWLAAAKNAPASI